MYTLLDCIKHKCRDSYVLYIPTVHPFGLVLLTHTLLVKTHTHDVSAPWLFSSVRIKKYIQKAHLSFSHVVRFRDRAFKTSINYLRIMINRFGNSFNKCSCFVSTIFCKIIPELLKLWPVQAKNRKNNFIFASI